MGRAAEDRAKARARRVPVVDEEGVTRMVAVRARSHGSRNVADWHGCQCAPCRGAAAVHSWRWRQGQRPAERPARLRKCARRGCRRGVPWLRGDTAASYAARSWHEDACRELAERAEAASRVRGRPGPKPRAKTCTLDGCDGTFTGRGRFHDPGCGREARRRARAAVKAPVRAKPQRRKMPKVAATRPVAATQATQATPAPVAPPAFRLGAIPTIEPPRRTKPRPSFGLSRRSA
jgi:hypothetical protein